MSLLLKVKRELTPEQRISLLESSTETLKTELALAKADLASTQKELTAAKLETANLSSKLKALETKIPIK